MPLQVKNNVYILGNVFRFFLANTIGINFFDNNLNFNPFNTNKNKRRENHAYIL